MNYIKKVAIRLARIAAQSLDWSEQVPSILEGHTLASNAEAIDVMAGSLATRWLALREESETQITIPEHRFAPGRTAFDAAFVSALLLAHPEILTCDLGADPIGNGFPNSPQGHLAHAVSILVYHELRSILTAYAEERGLDFASGPIPAPR